VNIAGSRTLAAPRSRVWNALLDPALLARALPGCRALTATSADAYDVQIEMGVGAIKGSYSGTIRIEDLREPEQYTMRIDTQGTAGFVNATAQVVLDQLDAERTELRYNADATVGGLVAGVGGRMLGGVAKIVIEQFFKNFQSELMKAQA